MSVEVLNDYGFAKRTPTLKSGKAGKARYTVTIKSEPLLIQTDPKALGKPVADAIAEMYREAIKSITASASPATIKAREAARRGVQRGDLWAMKRYSGGKTGTRVPAQTEKLFHDSGRLLESIKVGATSQGWVINVAGNRFDPNTLNGGEAALLRIMERLRELAPIWGDPQRIKDDVRFARAMRDVQSNMLRKATDRTVELQKQVMKTVWQGFLRLVA